LVDDITYEDVCWRTPNSLKDSNVSPSEKQRKTKESGCTP
jgi:hypothetical protein